MSKIQIFRPTVENFSKSAWGLLLLIGLFVSCGSPKDISSVSPETGDTKTTSVETTRYTVVLVNDPRLPSVPAQQINEALIIASGWIEKWYQKRTQFKIMRSESTEAYINSHFERLPIPEEWRRVPYALDGSDKITRFIRDQENIFKRYSVEELRSYVPDSVKPLIGSPHDSARNFLKLYETKMSVWRNLKTRDGDYYVDRKFPLKNGTWYWNRVFKSVWPEQVKDNLIITNVMLLDDDLQTATPHTMVRGGIMNGMAKLDAPQAIITTFYVFTDEPEISKIRDMELSDENRVKALAHIIAHEYGAHVIQGYNDVYNHEACLAEPTSGMEYDKTLKRLFSGPPCKLKHESLDRNEDRYQDIGVCYLAIENTVMAKKAFLRALEINPTLTESKDYIRQIDSQQ